MDREEIYEMVIREMTETAENRGQGLQQIVFSLSGIQIAAVEL